jgi:GT2 family glycosyltransferase
VETCSPGRNTGFAGGNNFGLARTATELVATLNPDTVPEPSWLEALVQAAREDPETAAFGSLQLMRGKRALIDGAGDCYHISGLFWRAGHGSSLPAAKFEAAEIFSPCAAAALYRKTALDEVGGFDEDFFCYGEDVDLGFRLRLSGHRSRLVPDAIVFHEGGGSSGGPRSDFAAYHGHRNMVWIYVKNMPGLLFWLLLPLHVLANIASMVILAFRGQGGIAWRAKRDALRRLPAMWKKRATRHGETGAIWRAMNKRWK